MLHTALICTFFALSPTSAPADVGHADLRQDTETLDSPVVLAQTRKRRGYRPVQFMKPITIPKVPKIPKRQEGDKNLFLVYFWKLFAPPGNYSMEVGLAGGMQFFETAYGDTNPNGIYRLHGAYRPAPGSIPVQLLASLDYTGYSQDAGKLSISNHTIGLGVGGGLAGWVGPIKLDLNVEVGPLLRMGSSSDDESSYTSFALSPAATATGGMAIPLFGHVALSARAHARATPPGRVHYSFIYGLEWFIDAKPVTIY